MTSKTGILSIIISLITLIIVVSLSTITFKRVSNLEKHHITTDGYSYGIDCVREAEIKYWRYKSELIDEVQLYINTVAPTSNLRAYAIIEECENYGIDPIFVLVQGEIESHFGTKGLGSKLNNVFNVGVFDDLTFNEVKRKYHYDYPNESIKPYLELLTTKYLVNKLEQDLMDNYVDINGNRYASNPDYEAILKTKYKYIMDNTEIDEKIAIVQSYAVKCNR